MPQCKKDSCKNPAADPTKCRGPYKQYCTEHLLEYQRKRREHEAIQRTLPDCQGGCGGKVGPARARMGHDTCLQCANEKIERDMVQQAHYTKLREFNEARTVAQLKAWMEKYVL